MNAIARRLREEIEQQGPIPFARFMQEALYAPRDGYYERESGVIGRSGDYYTNVSVGQLFGELLAFQFTEWLDELPSPPVQIVEAGAHDGQLAADILGYLGRKEPRLLARLAYWIIEPSPRRQAWQQQKLAPFANRLRWLDHVSELPRQGVNGIVFANELLDAFPICRLGWHAATQEWFEWGVKIHLDQFAWQRMPIRDPAKLAEELRRAGMNLPAEVKAALPDGFTVDFCPAAGTWWHQAATSLQSGRLLTIDYGATARELCTPERPHGTLRAYRQHHLSPDPLANPGEQDLTAHINFTQLQAAGEDVGLQTEGLFPQAQFLTRIVERIWQEGSPARRWTPAQFRQFKTLTHPEHLGSAFQALVQSRSAQGEGHCNS